MGLSLAKVGTGGHRYYLEAVAAGWEDDRPAGLEPDGIWMGASAPALGLAGAVSADDLNAIMVGANPDTGEILAPHRDRVRVIGFDLTFGSPKSASILFAIADPPVAREVRAGHDSAVSAALEYLERDALWARRGGGASRRQVVVNGAVGAGFSHRTSRAHDPHLHTHVLVANLVQDPEGRWSAIDARGLYLQARTAGFLFEAHMRHELTSRLGVEWGPVRNGRADLQGIDREVVRSFSRRQVQIQEYLSSRGWDGPGAARVATLATRSQKDLGIDFTELQERWRDRAASLGLSPERLRSALGRAPPGPTTRPHEEILLGLASEGSFSRRDLLRACCEQVRQGADVATLERMADDLLAPGLSKQVPPHTGRAGTEAFRRRDGARFIAGPPERRWEPSLALVSRELARVDRQLTLGRGAGRAEEGSGALAGAIDRRVERGALAGAMDRRVKDLGAEVVANPPGYLLAALGPCPDDEQPKSVWREAALSVAAYRERWEIADDSRALGAEPGEGAHGGGPMDVLRLAGRCRAEEALERAVRQLAPDLGRARGYELYRELGRDPGRELGRELGMGIT